MKQKKTLKMNYSLLGGPWNGLKLRFNACSENTMVFYHRATGMRGRYELSVRGLMVWRELKIGDTA